MAQRVEFARGVTSEECHPGTKILNREAPRVKFNRYIVIPS